MLARKCSKALLATCLCSTLVSYSGFAQAEDGRETVDPGEVIDILRLNPIENFRSELLADAENVRAALLARNVDEKGLVKSGQYAGQSALVLATIGDVRPSLAELINGENMFAHGRDAIFAAGALGDVEILDKLLEAGKHHKVFNGINDASFFTAEDNPHAATGAFEFGHTTAIQYLFDLGLDPNLDINAGQYDLLRLTVLGGHERAVDILLDAGHVVDCVYEFPNGKDIIEMSRTLGMEDAASRIETVCMRHN